MIVEEVGGTTFYIVSSPCDLTQMRDVGGEPLRVEPWKEDVWRLHVRFAPHWDSDWMGRPAELRHYYCPHEILRQWVVAEGERERLRHVREMAEIAAWAPPEEAP